MATGVGPPAGNCGRQEDENDDGRGHPPNPPIRPARRPNPPIRPHDGGYDCEFVKRPASDLGQADCPVCLLVLREPQQVTCCGYSYCLSCIHRVQADQNVCPTCNEQLTTFPNIGLKRALYCQKVYCVHRGLGCEWEKELRELDRHLNLQPPPEKLLEGCQFSEVECNLCLQPFQRRYLQVHQFHNCPKRPFACQHCNQHEATFEEIAQSHWPVCPSFPLPCPNNCDLVLQRQELEQHVRYDCPLTLVQCDFHIAGCGEYLARKDMPSHISENIVRHMSHLQLYMSTHPGANIAECMGLMVRAILKMAIENTHTCSQLHEAREKLRDLERAMITHTTRCEKQENRIDFEHIAMTQSYEMVSQQVSGLKESLAQQKDELTTMMKASEDKLDKSLATTETKFQTSLNSSEAKLQRSLVIREEKLQASLAEQQTKCSDEKRQLRQAITEQGKKQYDRDRKMEKLVDEKKCDMTKKMSAIENNLQTSLAAQQTTILVKCSDENRQLRQVITEQERKQQENEAAVMALKDDFSHKIATSEQNIHEQEAILTLHQQTLERVTCTGELPFDFTMTEFKSKKKNDVDWYSPPFYTHTHGYRMCINVNANGCRDGKGTGLSVFAYLMHGPYDDDLMWPFQGIITIQLLNQLEDGNHHKYTIYFNRTTAPTIINMVTTGERAGDGGGTTTFLPHTQLDLNSKGNYQYLRDDQLKFRVCKASNLDLTSHIHRRCLKLESFVGAIEPQVAVAPIKFTLSDFEQQKNQDSVWISPAFYTHQRGYRMCLEVYPNGDLNGQGTHVSIYTCMMRGPFDGGLKWPFRGNVTIQIVDQAGEKHHEMVVPYNINTPDSHMHANRMIDREWSIGLGFVPFLPHTSLGYNTVTNTQYLRANSLQIRISKVEIEN